MQVNSYRFQGRAREIIPEGTEKLIINRGIQVLPDCLCVTCRECLQEVCLPEGLLRIGDRAFEDCKQLLEIKISSSIEHIGDHAFFSCELLKTITFEESSTSACRLKTIGYNAFRYCSSLQRIMKVPSSLTMICEHAFVGCEVLLEADLSTATSLTEISSWVFDHCTSLQTVSLPHSLERIGEGVFKDCSRLVTVIVPYNSQPIKIGVLAFGRCESLANLALPKESVLVGNDPLFDGPFHQCTLLQDRFDRDDIMEKLMARFDKFPVHQLCYNHSTFTAENLLQRIKEQEDGVEAPLVDGFGMTPFHVHFSTIVGPNSQELLQVLLDEYPNYILGLKDANEKLAVDYLANNWSEESKILLQVTLQRWMVDPLVRWRAGTEAMQGTVNDILAADNSYQRSTLCTEAISAFTHYSDIEATSILEMALWKSQLRRGWNGSKRQALDRGESRCVCGSNVVIPNVAMFVGIRASSPDVFKN